MKYVEPSAQQRTFGNALEKEGAKAYQAFTVYRDLPADERSLTAVSQRLGKAKSLCARWSTQFRWVERATAWDVREDELKRKRRAQEREKMFERQLQQDRIAAQALMVPITALAKRAQKGEPFAGASDTQLAKIACFAARSLPRIHEDERALSAGSVDDQSAAQPRIVGAEFTWVESACQCTHRWGLHLERGTEAEEAPGKRPCTVHGCTCEHFSDTQDDA